METRMRWGRLVGGVMGMMGGAMPAVAQQVYVTCYIDIIFVGEPDLRERCPEDSMEVVMVVKAIDAIIGIGFTDSGCGDLRGDFNTDGCVDLADRNEVEMYIESTSSFPDVTDLNNDGQTDIADLIRFWNAYMIGSVRVDWNLDGVVDVADVNGYLLAYYGR